jgi:secreted trypsin-like serine protease
MVPAPVAWPASAYEVVVGAVWADGHGGDRHDVAQVLVEPDYLVTNGVGNDVTLMKLDSPAAVTPMRIAAVGERASWQPGKLATIAGFGATSGDATEMPDRMQSARVPITTDDYCAQAYESDGFDAQTMVCAGYPEGGTDTCEGDSGGPLLAAVPGGVRLAGATSFGAGCAQPGKPGVYARLAEGPIREWLKGVVPEAFAPEPVAAKAKPKKKRAARRCRSRRAKAHHRRARSRACRRTAHR